MKNRNKNNPIILQPDSNIGNSSAEADDEFLFSCIFEHPALASLQNVESSKIFASGRTGSGKTALIRIINRNQDRVSEINLLDLAMEYVANSDIIQFLGAIDVDLDLFYQALWRHVFCIEYIRLKFSVEDSTKSVNIFQQFWRMFNPDPRKQAALEYLRSWQSNFWITMDENIKEITERVEKGIDAELTAEVEKFKGRAGYARTLSSEKKSSLVARAKKIVNAKMLTDLSKVLDLLSEFEPDAKFKPNYILIDRLDEKWVDERVRYSLIRALIECLRSFRKIRDLKVIVAIRSDVLERVMQENIETGFQREKYDDYFLRIRWTKSQLRELVEMRINFLFRRKYSKDNVFFEDIFDKKVGNKESFDYILERTLLRPRDVISFVNECLSRSQGQAHVSQAIIRSCESEYSRGRLQALISEWRSVFPSIEIALRLLSGRSGRFNPGEISSKEFIEEFILECASLEGADHDPLFKQSQNYMKSGNISNVLQISKSLISALYRSGAVGVKFSKNEPVKYSYKDQPTIDPNLIDDDSKVQIHPMLHRALNIRDGVSSS